MFYFFTNRQSDHNQVAAGEKEKNFTQIMA